MKKGYKSGKTIKCSNCKGKVYVFPSYTRKYCGLKCRDIKWKKDNYNPFKGKTHSKVTLRRIVNSEGYKNKRSLKGTKLSDEAKKNMSKPRSRPAKEWNVNYRHDVKYEGPDRKRIINWCRQNGGIPDEIVTKWFLACEKCGWDKYKCDLDHKTTKKDGGNSNIENIEVLCPNCHRLKNFNVKRFIENRKRWLKFSYLT